jgi:Holliday junction resolvase RusA-like endonuclease
MEIEFPIEFLVEGTPVSLQRKRRAAVIEWQERVKTASATAIPAPHRASEGRIAVTLYYLPNERMEGDIDNIIKPILDALCQHIYIDDKQVERVVVQKFEPGNIFNFARPTTTFVAALTHAKPVLYVRISDDPFEELA